MASRPAPACAPASNTAQPASMRSSSVAAAGRPGHCEEKRVHRSRHRCAGEAAATPRAIVPGATSTTAFALSSWILLAASHVSLPPPKKASLLFRQKKIVMRRQSKSVLCGCQSFLRETKREGEVFYTCTGVQHRVRGLTRWGMCLRPSRTRSWTSTTG